MRFKEGQPVEGFAVIEPGQNEVSSILLYGTSLEEQAIANGIAARLNPVCELVPVTITVTRRELA